MDIQEIKHQNLLRLAKERNCIEQLGKRIDRQDQHINDIVKVMTRYKDESDRLWKELHTLKESDVSIIVYSLVSFIFPS